MAATNGAIQDDGNGGWLFQPASDYNGQVALSYQVSDSAGGTVDNVTRTFNLAAVNDAPTGSPAGVLANGEEDVAYTILQYDLLTGFSDVDGDTLSVTGLAAGSGGVLSAPATGDKGVYWTFTPNKDFNGSVSLTYGVTDGKGGNIAGVDRSFYLDPVNDMPQAGDDSGTVYEDATVTVTFADLLANDIDVDGSSRTIVGIDTAGTVGNVVLDTVNKTITYSANADEFDLLVNGNTTMDGFKYILQGSSGLQTSATVQISVLGVSDGNLNLVGTVQPETINGTAGEDRIKGNNGNDVLNGLDGADDLYGENGDDVLNGGDSIDNLFGGAGNDSLDGGNGNDWLAGEKGGDILTGGLGKDIFLFAKAGGNDVITDFANGIDKIQIAADTGIVTYSQLKITGGISADGIAYSVINMGSGGQVTLTGVQTSLLDSTDFIFPA